MQFETHRYIFAVMSNRTNVTSSREVFMQQKNGGRRERRRVYPPQGTSSEAVRIEGGI